MASSAFNNLSLDILSLKTHLDNNHYTIIIAVTSISRVAITVNIIIRLTTIDVIVIIIENMYMK